MAESLLLDSIKNNSKLGKEFRKNEGFGWCPGAKVYVRLIVQGKDEDRDITTPLGCNQWSCPVCSKKLAWILRKKTEKAIEQYIKSLEENGYRPEYFIKFLTLTCPGKEFRSNYTKEQSEVIIKKQFNKLRTALKARIGQFEYVWVNEGQRDGYPHLHVLLMGENIAPKGVLEIIKSLWETKYKMGFVYLQNVKGGARQIAWYMAKYISKEMRANKKHYRVYSMSRKFRKFFKMDNIEVTLIEFGRINYLPDGSKQFQPIWTIQGEFGGYPFDIDQDLMEKIKTEVFVQLKLPIGD